MTVGSYFTMALKKLFDWAIAHVPKSQIQFKGNFVEQALCVYA